MGALVHRLKVLAWTLFYRATGRLFFASCGPACYFEGWVHIPQRGSIHIGSGVRICRNVEFSVTGTLVIDRGVFIGPGVVISARERVTIGENSMLAEYVCIHDSNHAGSGWAHEAITIGANCWIGAHCVLVKGAGMADGCTLGAGAVLNKFLPMGTTGAGVPARALPIPTSNFLRDWN